MLNKGALDVDHERQPCSANYDHKELIFKY